MPKIFLLDTSVILYDAGAINNFEENDVAVPITVLDELDQFKKGNGVIHLQARDFMRELDRISKSADIRAWVPLNGPTKGKFRIVDDSRHTVDAAKVYGSRKNDHRILNAALSLAQEEKSRPVILVSKDINLRIKARGLGIEAEDYETVRIADVAGLYTGRSEIDVVDSVIDDLYGQEHLDPEILEREEWVANHYFILRGSAKSALAYFNPRSSQIELVRKSPAYGIVPRNAEQTFALHAILNQETPLVSISGPAGTGKTLLALAGALAQRRSYRQIFLSRPVVPLSNKDLGYLPGDVDSKIGPYMQPLWDNLGFIRGQFKSSDKEHQRIDEMLELEKLHVLPLAYIRGRSLSSIVFIVDEAQNLTPHEIKTIITRAGDGTKVIFTGDTHQIDTPYMDAHSNGLSYLIDRIQGHRLYAHVNLSKGERSELANLGSQLL